MIAVVFAVIGFQSAVAHELISNVAAWLYPKLVG